MGFITVPGVRKLSELIIDADKDWGDKRIIHLPAPVNGSEPSTKSITVQSDPPTGNLKIDNAYIDPVTSEMVMEGV